MVQKPTVYFDGTLFTSDFPVKRIRLPYRSSDYFNSFRYVFGQRIINHRKFGIGRGVNHWLPPKLTQVFNELEPTLHSRPTAWRPIIGYYQYFMHQIIIYLSGIQIWPKVVATFKNIFYRDCCNEIFQIKWFIISHIDKFL